MNHLPEIFNAIVQRELRAFKRELEAYPDDASVWHLPSGVSNSAGTLALHCAGNLQHYIGGRLGGSGYVRDRDAEFRRRDVPRVELYRELERAMLAVENTFGAEGPSTLPDVYPEKIGGQTIATDVYLIHLVAHLGYHLGQVDYHRRLTTGDGVTVDGISVRELPPAPWSS